MRTLIFGGQSFSAEDYKKYFVDDFKLIESIDKIKDIKNVIEAYRPDTIVIDTLNHKPVNYIELRDVLGAFPDLNVCIIANKDKHNYILGDLYAPPYKDWLPRLVRFIMYIFKLSKSENENYELKVSCISPDDVDTPKDILSSLNEMEKIYNGEVKGKTAPLCEQFTPQGILMIAIYLIFAILLYVFFLYIKK